MCAFVLFNEKYFIIKFEIFFEIFRLFFILIQINLSGFVILKILNKLEINEIDIFV